jgi:membrane protein
VIARLANRLGYNASHKRWLTINARTVYWIEYLWIAGYGYQGGSVMKKFKEFVIDFYHVWLAERPAQLAAAMAYYGVFSFVPIIYIAFTFVEFIGNKISLLDVELDALTMNLDPKVYSAFSAALSNISNPTASGTVIGALIGFGALLFAASGLFFQLQFSLNSIWRVPAPQKGGTRLFILQRLLSILMVIGIGLLLITILVINIIIHWFQSILTYFWDGASQLQFFNYLASIGVLFVTLLLVYKYIPNRKIFWRDAMIGSGVSTTLLLLTNLIFTWLLRSGGFSSSFNIAGSFALILIGIYYLAQIILLGAVVSRVSEKTFLAK